MKGNEQEIKKEEGEVRGEEARKIRDQVREEKESEGK